MHAAGVYVCDTYNEEYSFEVLCRALLQHDAQRGNVTPHDTLMQHREPILDGIMIPAQLWHNSRQVVNKAIQVEVNLQLKYSRTNKLLLVAAILTWLVASGLTPARMRVFTMHRMWCWRWGPLLPNLPVTKWRGVLPSCSQKETRSDCTYKMSTTAELSQWMWRRYDNWVQHNFAVSQ